MIIIKTIISTLISSLLIFWCWSSGMGVYLTEKMGHQFPEMLDYKVVLVILLLSYLISKPITFINDMLKKLRTKVPLHQERNILIISLVFGISQLLIFPYIHYHYKTYWYNKLFSVSFPDLTYGEVYELLFRQFMFLITEGWFITITTLGFLFIYAYIKSTVKRRSW